MFAVENRALPRSRLSGFLNFVSSGCLDLKPSTSVAWSVFSKFISSFRPIDAPNVHHYLTNCQRKGYSSHVFDISTERFLMLLRQNCTTPPPFELSLTFFSILSVIFLRGILYFFIATVGVIPLDLTSFRARSISSCDHCRFFPLFCCS